MRRLQHALLLVFLVGCVVFIVRDLSARPLKGVSVIGMIQLCSVHVVLVFVNVLRY